jgi:chemotaxis protein MotB
MPEKPVIIKRGDEEAHDDHHGGAWKVAYADFMTAMMAFFLLLWILAASDEEKLRGLADYFTPSLSEAGGRGQGFFDGQVLADDGTLSGTDGPQSVERLPSFGQENPLAVFDSRLRDEEEVALPDANELRETVPDDGQPPGAHNTADAAAEESGGSVSYGDDQENERLELLERLRDQIEAAVAADPELAGLQRHLRFELSPEGLEIQMVDDERRSMFDLGSANLDGRTRDLVALVGRAIAPINKPVAISGHTDSLPFGPAAAYTNWELSTDRAHATRRELVAQGVSPGRFLRIVGLADTVPLDPDLPDAPENRRIGILLVYPSAVRAEDVDLRQN